VKYKTKILELNKPTRNGTVYTENSFKNIKDAIGKPLIESPDNTTPKGVITDIEIKDNFVYAEMDIEEPIKFAIAPEFVVDNVEELPDGTKLVKGADFISCSLVLEHSQESCNYKRD